MMRRRLDIWTVALFGTWAIVLVLLVWPLSSIVQASFVKDGAFTLSQYAEILTESRYLNAVGNTFLVGFGGMLGATILGVALAFVVTRFTIRGRRIIEVLALIALVSPPFIGAYAWIVLFGSNGMVRRALRDIGITIPPIYGAAGVILVFSLKFFPNVFLITSGAFAAVSRSLEEAAESLGLSPTRRVLKVTLPLILPAITAGGLLAFVLSIADFGTPQIIGRGFQVLSTQAFTLYSAEIGTNPGLASAISLILVAISMVFVLLQRWLLRRDIYHSTGMKIAEPIRLRGGRNILAHGVAYLIVLLGSVPAIIAIVFSFRRTRGPVFQPGFALQSYERIIETVPEAIRNTLVFSAFVVVAIVIVGTLVGYVVTRRPSPASITLDGLMIVPYVVPGIVMGIAYVATFNTPPLTMTGTALIIILSVFIRRLPYAVRAVGTALRQVSPSLEEAAMSLGYSPGRAFLKVTAPLIVPGILAGALMSLVTAMNELSSSLVLYVGGTITMPVRIYVAVIDGDYGSAAALSSILIVLTTIAVLLASRLARGRSLS
jgi:iron(III) transport system permease protein